jgi:peptide/nickel transport system permease protein
LVRLARYTAGKGLALFVTVVVGMYLTILIINLGGHVDEIFRSQIAFQVGLMIYDGWPEGVEEPERTEIIEQTIWAMEEAKGLHRPFLERSGRWLVQALTLDLSERRAGFHAQVGNVQALIRERLPYTLLLVGISNVVLFMATISAALVLSRKHGGLLDRLNVLLLSLTSAPSWIHGVVLLLIFAGTLHILPFPRRWDQLPDRFTLDYALLMLRYMILPAAAIVVSGFFQGVYAWRAFFLIFRHEDYVEIARAKGLRPGAIERSYILRPTLPYVLTNFATMLIVFWQGAIALEMVFLWPGIGPLFMQAVRFFDTPLLLGIVVIFAYLLALTVFLLDIIYALVDPRVRVGSAGTGSRLRSARTGRRLAVRPRRWPAEAVARLRATGAWFASLAGRLGTTGSGWRARRRTPIENSERPAAEGKPAGTWRERLAQLGPALREVARSPSALLGAAVILGMLAVSIYVVIALPRDEVVTLWRGQGSDVTRALWYRNPKNAVPAWTNLLRKDPLPTTIALRTRPGEATPVAQNLPWITGLESSSLAGRRRVVTPAGDNAWEVTLSLAFNYPYRTFPQDVAIYLDVEHATKKPHARMTWVTPDGEEISLGTMTISSRTNTAYLSQDSRLQRRYGERTAVQGLFADRASEVPVAQSGRYELRIDGMVFEEASAIDAELVVHGRVAGLSGTDDKRRDLMVALAWGMPVALAFGLLGTLGTSLLSMTLAAVSVWFGGWVDAVIQRLTELNMILPTLPIVILVYYLYSKSIWAILGVVVVLGIFGSAIKNYRSAFLQMKEAPYIEAGQAYGAGGWRIIGRYLVPRILPVMVPQMAILVPSYVFLEATLAYLGVFDPALPTWGKVINEALTSGFVVGRAYWVLQPVALLVVTGLAFTGLGFALERILNPHLREV